MNASISIHDYAFLHSLACVIMYMYNIMCISPPEHYMISWIIILVFWVSTFFLKLYNCWIGGL